MNTVSMEKPKKHVREVTHKISRSSTQASNRKLQQNGDVAPGNPSLAGYLPEDSDRQKKGEQYRGSHFRLTTSKNSSFSVKKEVEQDLQKVIQSRNNPGIGQSLIPTPASSLNISSMVQEDLERLMKERKESSKVKGSCQTSDAATMPFPLPVSHHRRILQESLQPLQREREQLQSSVSKPLHLDRADDISTTRYACESSNSSGTMFTPAPFKHKKILRKNLLRIQKERPPASFSTFEPSHQAADMFGAKDGSKTPETKCSTMTISMFPHHGIVPQYIPQYSQGERQVSLSPTFGCYYLSDQRSNAKEILKNRKACGAMSETAPLFQLPVTKHGDFRRTNEQGQVFKSPTLASSISIDEPCFNWNTPKSPERTTRLSLSTSPIQRTPKTPEEFRAMKERRKLSKSRTFGSITNLPAKEISRRRTLSQPKFSDNAIGPTVEDIQHQIEEGKTPEQMRYEKPPEQREEGKASGQTREANTPKQIDEGKTSKQIAVRNIPKQAEDGKTPKHIREGRGLASQITTQSSRRTIKDIPRALESQERSHSRASSAPHKSEALSTNKRTDQQAGVRHQAVKFELPSEPPQTPTTATFEQKTPHIPTRNFTPYELQRYEIPSPVPERNLRCVASEPGLSSKQPQVLSPNSALEHGTSNDLTKTKRRPRALDGSTVASRTSPRHSRRSQVEIVESHGSRMSLSQGGRRSHDTAIGRQIGSANKSFIRKSTSSEKLSSHSRANSKVIEKDGQATNIAGQAPSKPSVWKRCKAHVGKVFGRASTGQTETAVDTLPVVDDPDASNQTSPTTNFFNQKRLDYIDFVGEKRVPPLPKDQPLRGNLPSRRDHASSSTRKESTSTAKVRPSLALMRSSETSHGSDPFKADEPTIGSEIPATSTEEAFVDFLKSLDGPKTDEERASPEAFRKAAQRAYAKKLISNVAPPKPARRQHRRLKRVKGYISPLHTDIRMVATLGNNHDKKRNTIKRGYRGLVSSHQTQMK